ncbi:hypothetical protein MVES1_001487 [Malassezia vespertilionis]|uniref:JmjC domain-containing protein n=1 Tax=Malassezia vespertilionis TaxID=2020962 RepID=A0A2N1JCF0_9BASI|nr:uncharacterized protein MVES1_001487 [Malassezia vespertilionis]PKI84213.1 hypothetical protein MVES_001400 [Malassezia vespertilionis]WFD06145.1 hypothetical protein MVES1_001487 [Malassezia vespertilionis]
MYAGWVPLEDEPIAAERASITAEKMWDIYISKRRPVLFDGLLDDPAWHGDRWTDTLYLERHAGDAVVRVEPIHPEQECFGTATPRTTINFKAYLDVLKEEECAGRYYLTTQYESEDAAEEVDEDCGPVLETVLPSPTHALKNDFPLQPRIVGNLALQQCNLWLGNGREERSSGLHHDFHDNLYVLLEGRKRFVLFPPSAHPFLHIRGDIARVHKNGLLVYDDADRIRADGLHVLDAAHWRLAACARALHANPKKRARLEGECDYQAAKDAYHALRRRYEDESEDELSNTEDSSDSSEHGSPLASGSSDSSEHEFPTTDDALALDEHNGEKVLDALDATLNEPSSFSLIKPHVLHHHFSIPSSSAPSPKDITPLPNCPRPLVVELKAGQMLYLPASWFHEVTSAATDKDRHMAFNYWMHPPDGDSFAQPYKDAKVWDEVRTKVAEAAMYTGR